MNRVEIKSVENGYVVMMVNNVAQGVEPTVKVFGNGDGEMTEMLEAVSHSLDSGKMVKVLVGDQVANFAARRP